MGNRDIEAALRYHGGTKHSEASLRAHAHRLDWENQPLPFKLYRALAPIPLPRDLARCEMPALRALGGEAGPEGGGRRLELTRLARVLRLSAGITKRKRHPGGEVWFRAYPNTGALYHIDVYVVCGDLPGLDAGVYHFGPQDFALRRLREGDWRAVLVAASGGEPSVTAAPAILVMASTYWRNAWKYRARAYRHCFWDAGTLHANLLAAAAAERLPARVVVGFVDAAVTSLLSLDPEREAALTLVPLGRGVAGPETPVPSPLELAIEPLSAREVDYPEIRAMHAASSLAEPAAVRAWRTARRASPSPAAADILPLSPHRPEAWPEESLEGVILRRGSTRAFDPDASISVEDLATVLERAMRPISADVLPLLELYLIVHAVDGLAPGAYVYHADGGGLERLREGSFRREAGRLALFQELAADAAVNVYSLTDLGRVLEAYGNRGYRAAQLEGGIRGGRLYLGAYALRFGATGLTFLDDDVTEFFGPRARRSAVMFLTALGRSRR